MGQKPSIKTTDPPLRAAGQSKQGKHFSMPQLSSAAAPDKRVDLLDALWERAQSRAYLWSIGEYSLHEAVDALQASAVRDGLVERIGQDAVQTILVDAFFPYRGAADA
jgi:ribosomal protein S12 methylthiotransferase accessory factor YcaO